LNVFLELSSCSAVRSAPFEFFLDVELELVADVSVGPYLVLATKTNVVGTLFGAKIEQITKVALVPISRRQLDSSEAKSVNRDFPLSNFLSHLLDLVGAKVRRARHQSSH